MSGNWSNQKWRANQMRYNGRYPINEMWDVRQSLIQDFGRNVSTNKYLSSMDRKCYEYVQTCRDKRFNKYNWRNREKRDSGKDSDDQDNDELNQNYDENKGETSCQNQEKRVSWKDSDDQENGKNQTETLVKTSRYDDDIPSDNFYLDFDRDKREFGLTNAELIVKEEPETSDNERNNVNYIAKTFSDSNADIRSGNKSCRSESDKETNSEIQEAKRDTENNIDTTEHSGKTFNDDVDGSFHGNSDLLVDENKEVTESKKSQKSKKLETPEKQRLKDTKELEDSPAKRKSKNTKGLDSHEKQRLKELDSPEKAKKRLQEFDSPDKRKSKESDSPDKQKSKEFEKIKNYKQFVRTVSKLVNKKRKDDSSDKQNEEVDKNSEATDNSKNNTSNSENKNTQKVCINKTNGKSKLKVTKTTEKKDTKINRSTRSSSRSAKVDSVEKLSIKKKDSKVTKPLDSKENSSSYMKTRNKYKSRLRSNSENVESGDEVEVTSTSKQSVKEKDNGKMKKRKSVSSPEDDIPLAKYSKFLSKDIGAKSGSDRKDLDNENELDETIDYSNSDDNKPTGSQIENTFSSDCDLSKHKQLLVEKNDVELSENSYSEGTANVNNSAKDRGSSPSKNKICENMKDVQDNLNLSLIIIDEPDSSKKPESEFQIGTDLDCYNNNKDMKDSDKVGSTSTQEEKLWEYLKCDFCDFLVSKKKSQNYQLMEEHLESTKHNAASIVKVSITDGELKPLFVKKEHAILFSLEKASILPYCPTCCTVMPSIWTVQLHARFKHQNHAHKDIYSLGKVESVVNVPIPKKIDMCKQCGQRKIHIQKHWKSHNHYPYVQPTEDQIALYSCNICHRHFESFFSALSHAVVHTQDGQRGQNIGVKVTYLCKSNQTLTLLPREKTLTSGRAIEMLNQARAANKTGQWTRSQRKEFETMAIEWKRHFKQH